MHRLLSSTCEENSLWLLSFDELGSFQTETRLYHIPSAAIRLAWSRDGRRLVSVHADGELRIWDSIARSPILNPLPAVDASLSALAVDRRNGRIAAGDTRGRIWVYRNNSGPPRLLGAGADEVVHMAFAPDSTLAVALKNGDLARIKIDVDGDITWTASNSNIQRVAWLADGKILAATTPTNILLLDETGKLSRRDVAVLTPEQTIGGILVAPGHAGVIISISNGTLLQWGPESGGPARPLVPPQARGDTLSAMSLALDPSGRWLTATRADDELRIYDLTARISPQVLPLSTRDSKTIAFSPEGTLLAALTSDAKLAVWRFDAHEGKSEPLVTIDAVPTELRPKAKDASLRQAQWIDWIDNDRLAIAGDRSRPLLRSAELGKPPQSTRPR